MKIGGEQKSIPGARALVALSVCLGLLGTACVSPPRYELRTPMVHVRADDEATARFSSAEVEAALPRLRALLAPEQDTPVELWVQDDLPFFPEPWRENVLGYSIHDRQQAFVERPDADLDAWREVLVHELTHLVVDKEFGDVIGFALEEALCRNLSVDLLSDGRAQARVRAQWWVDALLGGRRDSGIRVSVGVRVDPASDSRISWPLFRTTFACDDACAALALDVLPVLDEEPRSDVMNAASRAAAALVMWRVVRVHGWDDALLLLRERPLERDSAAATAWTAHWLARAGLPPHADAWFGALLADLDPAFVMARVLDVADSRRESTEHAAVTLAGVFLADRRHFGDADLESWIKRREPFLRLAEFGLETPLEGHAEFLAALQRAWDDPPEGVAEFNLGHTLQLVKAAKER